MITQEKLTETMLTFIMLLSQNVGHKNDLNKYLFAELKLTFLPLFVIKPQIYALSCNVRDPL